MTRPFGVKIGILAGLAISASAYIPVRLATCGLNSVFLLAATVRRVAAVEQRQERLDHAFNGGPPTANGRSSDGRRR